MLGYNIANLEKDFEFQITSAFYFANSCEMCFTSYLGFFFPLKIGHALNNTVEIEKGVNRVFLRYKGHVRDKSSFLFIQVFLCGGGPA